MKKLVKIVSEGGEISYRDLSPAEIIADEAGEMRFRGEAHAETGASISVAFTPERLAERIADDEQSVIDDAAEEVERTKRAQKKAGIDFGGSMLSATSTDQSGLTAVAMAVVLARQNSQVIKPIKFQFENGTKLTITDSNFDALYATWAPFRQLFFA